MRIVIAVAAAAGLCGTPAFSADNPPPERALAGFSTYTLKPGVVDPPFDRNMSYYPHVEKLDVILSKELQDELKDWNAFGATDGNGAGLIIEPHIRRMKLVRGGMRFLAGPFAGGSSVLIRVVIKDASNGSIVAEPEFLVRSSAFKGTFTMGERDRNILSVAARRIEKYLSANYVSPVGGSRER